MTSHIYPVADRPDVEVLVDGTRHEGEMRGWWGLPEAAGGGRVLQVQWRREPGTGTLIDELPVGRVRLV